MSRKNYITDVWWKRKPNHPYPLKSYMVGPFWSDALVQTFHKLKESDFGSSLGSKTGDYFFKFQSVGGPFWVRSVYCNITVEATLSDHPKC